jgi:hypothetical protein
MNLELLSVVREKLEVFEAASPYNTREIETCMEALATQIARLMEADEDRLDSLADAIQILKIDKASKNDMCEILDELQVVIDASDYDGTDEDDKEDSISNLKTDFYYLLTKVLDKLELKK